MANIYFEEVDDHFNYWSLVGAVATMTQTQQSAKDLLVDLKELYPQNFKNLQLAILDTIKK